MTDVHCVFVTKHSALPGEVSEASGHSLGTEAWVLLLHLVANGVTHLSRQGRRSGGAGGGQGGVGGVTGAGGVTGRGRGQGERAVTGAGGCVDLASLPPSAGCRAVAR